MPGGPIRSLPPGNAYGTTAGMRLNLINLDGGMALVQYWHTGHAQKPSTALGWWGGLWQHASRDDLTTPRRLLGRIKLTFRYPALNPLDATCCSS